MVTSPAVTPSHAEIGSRKAAGSERAEARFTELWNEVRELQAAADLLEWDQRVFMPAGGRRGRARTLEVMAAAVHRKLVDPELLDLLAELGADAQPGGRSEAMVNVARLEVDRAVRLPESLVKALASAASEGMGAWQAAREAGDFRLFAPALERLVELRSEEAAAVLPGRPAYDAALQLFEPGATEQGLVPLFDELRNHLSPVAIELSARRREPAESTTPKAKTQALSASSAEPFTGHFPEHRQEVLVRRVLGALGLDAECSRLDRSTHPFCFGLHPGDVRLTWRCREDDPRVGLFAALHEAGHALYEQGLPRETLRTPLGRDASFGLHESQSRLVENQIGRSRGFWKWLWLHYREAFPETPADLRAHWLALHRVCPSPIRTEADPTSYDLHIAVRFELERRLFARDLTVSELPAAWNELYRKWLGIEPAHDGEGVLQDIHWSEGLFGYFPAYTLGNLAAAQLFAAARRELGDPDDAFAEGRFAPLVEWLRRNVHAHGSRYTTSEIVEKATGSPLGTSALLAHLGRYLEIAESAP